MRIIEQVWLCGRGSWQCRREGLRGRQVEYRQVQLVARGGDPAVHLALAGCVQNTFGVVDLRGCAITDVAA